MTASLEPKAHRHQIFDRQGVAGGDEGPGSKPDEDRHCCHDFTCTLLLQFSHVCFTHVYMTPVSRETFVYIFNLACDFAY